MSMKEEINSNTIIVGDFNTLLTTMDRSTKQKINKETQTLKDTMDQLDLIDIYRTSITPKQSTSPFSQVHTEHSPEEITSWAINLVLVNSKKLKSFQSSFLTTVQLDLNYREKIIKNSNIWGLNNTLLNNQQIIEEIKKEIKICIEMNENENTTTRSQDGGGIGWGDHFLSYKFIERTIERRKKFTKQLLIFSSGHQAPRKAAHCLQREVGQNIKD